MGSYTIKISDNKDFIEIIVIGDLDRNLAHDYIVESHKLGAENGIDKYMVNAVEARNVETPVGNFDFGDTDLKKIDGFNRNARIAILAAEGDDSHDFVETVVVNRGYVVKLFHNRKEALHYLDVAEE